MVSGLLWCDLCMVLRMDGEWHVGGEAVDLDEFLREIGADGYPVHEVRHAVCGQCGGQVFGIVGDPAGGTMQRECRGCGSKHFMLGSRDFWSDVDTQISVCVCEEADWNIAVGYSLYTGIVGIRSLATAERCVACGKIGSFMARMVRGDMQQIDQA
jgi:DNA-directed RNA polymerase subunit RPC12/RpoP